jgi:uncharacterized protein
VLVYQATLKEFLSDVGTGQIDTIIEEKVLDRLKRRVGASEKRSWGNSLQQLGWAFHESTVPDDAGVCIECQLPMSSKRIDFILSGYGSDNRPRVIIVELKQWSDAEKTQQDAIVRTRFGSSMVPTSHPSYQAWSYAAFLENFNEAVEAEGVSLMPCAYLHNYTDNGILTDPFYAAHVERAPLFFKEDLPILKEFLERYIKKGDQGELMYTIDHGRIRPSKQLADSLGRLLQGNHEFVLLDEQKVAFEEGMAAIRRAKTGAKEVLIVRGGPGTGKSVVAVNQLVAAINENYNTAYVTKNAAPRAVYQSKLIGTMTKTAFGNLFMSSGNFMDVEADCFDALVVDEAHRLVEKSGLYGNLGESQPQEIIRAARCSIFFIDECQRVHIKDVGSEDLIRRLARDAGAEVTTLDLPSQFRCNGSDGYLAWVDHVLDIQDTAQVDLVDVDYDFRVFDSPCNLDDFIRRCNDADGTSRLVAGYTWRWQSKKNKEAMDVTYPDHNYERQWNLTGDGSLWAVKEGSIDQIGCIHTCQGLDLSHVGVFIGPDLVVRNGRVITRPEERAQHDASIKGWKKRSERDPEGTEALMDALIKNTYRVLMTRGMRGCAIYSDDDETREYFQIAMGPVSKSAGALDDGH